MNMKRIKAAILLAAMVGSPWAMAITSYDSPTGGTGNVSFDYTLKTGACSVSVPAETTHFFGLTDTGMSGSGLQAIRYLGRTSYEFILSNCNNMDVNLTLDVIKGSTSLKIAKPSKPDTAIAFVYPDGNVYPDNYAPFLEINVSNGTESRQKFPVNTPYLMHVNSDSYDVSISVFAYAQHLMGANLVKGTYTAQLAYTFSYQ
ncbi:hypothetical protein HF234_003740 [Salmonella enterica]|nr:hypothetical protein [Salmonella enterica]